MADPRAWLDPPVIEAVRTSAPVVTSNPRNWGAFFWTMLIYIALNYPNEPDTAQRDQYRQFFLSLGPVLPCEICRQNYAGHLANVPLEEGLNSRIDLLHWLNQIYNAQPQNQPLELGPFLARYLRSPHSQPAHALGLSQYGGGLGNNSNRWLWGVAIIATAGAGYWWMTRATRRR